MIVKVSCPHCNYVNNCDTKEKVSAAIGGPPKKKKVKRTCINCNEKFEFEVNE